MDVIKNIALIGTVLLVACNYKIVKEEKFISTDKFKAEAFKICMSSKGTKGMEKATRKTHCQKDADNIVTTAEKKYREYKADEHNYRLCRSKYPSVPLVDKCFIKRQEKYYNRELETYRNNLNK